MKVFTTGGTVRDWMLGRKAKDMDCSVEAESFDAMRDGFLAMGGTIWQERPEFLTIRGKLPGVGDADFVLCRKDGCYTDGRRPDIVEPGTVFDDLKRRDFTVNAMARLLLPDGTFGNVLDPHDGRWDLKFKRLRCVGRPEDRFHEDSLRMVRALRFAVVLGFTFEPDLAAALKNPDLVDRLSCCAVERVRDEMFKAFRCDTAGTLALLGEFPALRDKVFSRGLWLRPTLED